jgi:hypothetical protein
MRAYVVERPEGAFRETELPRPVPAEGQVLVRINASGVNPLDIKIRAGKAGHAKQRLPAVLVDEGKLRPLLNQQRFSPVDIDGAYSLVESGALGKVVVDF